MSNKKQLSLYVDRDMVRHVKILLLQRDDGPSLSQLVENLLDLTIEKALEGDEKWLKRVVAKTSEVEGKE